MCPSCSRQAVSTSWNVVVEVFSIHIPGFELTHMWMLPYLVRALPKSHQEIVGLNVAVNKALAVDILYS